MHQLTPDHALNEVRESIASVAPDVEDELTDLGLTADLFENLDLDSMDHVNVMIQLYERTGVDIAERDYGSLRTLKNIVSYLVTQTAAA